MKITQKSCPTCGETLTMEILNEGFQVNWVCQTHGIVRGTISNQKYGMMNRINPYLPHFYGTGAVFFSIFSMITGNWYDVGLSLIWLKLMMSFISLNNQEKR